MMNLSINIGSVKGRFGLERAAQLSKAAGFDSMVYFNPSQSRTQMHLEELVDYPFWLAAYTDRMPYPYLVEMWQYTDRGRVPGIEGNVDINVMFFYE